MPKDIIVGINVHNPGYTPYTNTLQQNLDDCAAMGMKIIRYNSSSNSPEALNHMKYVADECHKRGMKLMLCVDYYGWKDQGEHTDAEWEAHWENYFEVISSTLKENVDIYQVFNETDNACMGGNIFNITSRPQDGKHIEEYDYVMLNSLVHAMRGALKGLKKGYDKAVTSMNFCWWHTAALYKLYEEGCRWDIIGLDWYSDCEEVSSIDLIVAEVASHIPEGDFMICETNQWMNFHARWDEEKRALIANKESRDALQAQWVPSFIQKLYDLDEPRFKGVIFYELLDEPGFERHEGHYHGESHFGFIECDEQGGNRVFKPVCKTCADKIKELGI